MRRVCLTEAQRKETSMERACEKMHQSIVDGLAVHMNRERLNYGLLSEELGINRKTLTKLLHMEEVRIGIKMLIKIVHIIGLEIKPRNQA